MILDVGPLLRGETDCIKIDYMLTPDKLDGVTFNGDAHVLGTLTDNAGYMRLTLKAELSYSSECARCLAPVDGVFSLELCYPDRFSEPVFEMAARLASLMAREIVDGVYK